MADELFHLDHRGSKPPLSHQRFTEIQQLLDGLQPDVWCAGHLAAGLHSFDGYRPQRPYHFVVHRSTNRHRVGHFVHRSLYLPAIDLETAWGLPVTSPTRTLIDLAATETPQALTAALDGALRDRQTTETFLHSRIADLRRSGRHGIPKLLAVIEGVEASRGGHSWLERRYLELLAEHGLPRPDTQVTLGKRDGHLIRVDCHFPDTRVVVELLGYRYHRTEMQMRVDAERANRLTLNGYLVIQFPYTMVVQQPAEVIADTVAALSRVRAA